MIKPTVNWKTTTAGVAAIAGGASGFYFGYKNNNLTPELVTSYITAIVTGIGLICARDVNVTSTDLGLQTTKPTTDVVIDRPAEKKD